MQKNGVAVAIAMILQLGAVHAEELAQPLKLEIAAQPIDDALNEFARQSGLQVFLLASNDTRRLKSAPVFGMYEPRAALNRMLTDTGLSYEQIDARSIAVVDPASKKSAAALAEKKSALEDKEAADHPLAPERAPSGSPPAAGQSTLSGTSEQAPREGFGKL